MIILSKLEVRAILRLYGPPSKKELSTRWSIILELFNLEFFFTKRKYYFLASKIPFKIYVRSDGYFVDHLAFKKFWSSYMFISYFNFLEHI